MEYIFTIAGLCGMLFIIQRYIPAAWQIYTRWIWLGVGLGIGYNFLTSPYRLMRLWQDLLHLLG